MNVKEYTLGEVCSRLSSGKSIKASQIFERGSFPVFGGNGVRGFTESYNFDGECAIIGRQGAYCGNVQFHKGRAYMTEHAVVVCGNENGNTKFLSFVLREMDLGRLSHQAAQPGLSVKILAEQKITLPSIEVQTRVANILSAYDDLIENNQKQIKLLEEAAQRLYKEWFVDLRFPGYENTPITDGVPQGWRLDEVKSVVSLLSGYAFKSSDFVDNGKYGIVTIKNVQDGNFDGENVNTIAEIPSKMPSHCNLNNGDILLSLTGNVGRVCLVNGDKYLLNQRVAKLDSKYPAYAYCLFRNKDMFDIMNNLANGAAQQNLSPIRTENVRILIPSDSLIQKFEDIVSPMIAKMLVLNQSNGQLKQARDRLLPKLMSGELEV